MHPRLTLPRLSFALLSLAASACGPTAPTDAGPDPADAAELVAPACGPEADPADGSEPCDDVGRIVYTDAPEMPAGVKIWQCTEAKGWQHLRRARCTWTDGGACLVGCGAGESLELPR